MVQDYTSENTQRLTIPEKEKLLTVDYVRAELGLGDKHPFYD